MRRSVWTTAVAAVTVALLAVETPAAHAGPEPAPAAAHEPVPDGARPASGPAGFCDGDGPVPLVVEGDLIVTGTCYLGTTTVLGDLVVEAGADARISPSRVAGDVRVGPGGTAWLYATAVGGGVHLDRARELGVSGTVARSIRGKADSVDVADAVVRGAINLAASERVRYPGFRLFRSEVGGWVNVYGGQVEIGESVLRRGLTLSWVRGAGVCEGRVAADVTIRHARGPVEVGGVPMEDHCELHPPRESPVFESDLLVLDNTGDVTLRQVVVRGDLDCSGNTGRLLPGVLQDGERRGQCA